MPRQLHLEGPELEPLIAQARADHGDDVTVVRAQRVRSGGFAGFFTRERYEVTVDLTGADATAAAAPVSATPVRPAAVPVAATKPVVASSMSAFVSGPAAAAVAAGTGGGSIEDLLAAADRADSAAVPAVATSHATAASGTAAPSYAPACSTAGSRTGTVLAGRTVTAPVVTAPVVTAPVVTASVVTAPVVRAVVTGPVPASDERSATSSDGSTPDQAGVPGPRRPGRTLSTETRGFDEVLAALRADLLGPGTTEALDRTTPDPPSPAAPWQPMTIVDAPEPGTAPDPEPEPAVPAPEPAAEPAPEPAPVAATAVQAPKRAGRHAASHSTTSAAPELVALARLVGSDPTRAAAAAAEVTASGATSPQHTLPLLAASLAQALAPRSESHPADALRSARPGELVVVVGAPEEVARTASDVAAHLGTAWTARWSAGPAPSGGSAELVLHDARHLPPMLALARDAGFPLVLELADPSLGHTVAAAAGTARAGVVRDLDPDLVVLGVAADSSARRQEAVLTRMSAAYGTGRPLLLALEGCDQASAPLAHTGWPVALVDGRPATVGTWTGILLDALRWLESA